jgi:hypothetical protein
VRLQSCSSPDDLEVKLRGTGNDQDLGSGYSREPFPSSPARPWSPRPTPAASCDLGIAAAICFHRGDLTAARRHLADAAPYAERTGTQVIGPLLLARSLEHEHAGDPAAALAARHRPH